MTRRPLPVAAVVVAVVAALLVHAAPPRADLAAPVPVGAAPVAPHLALVPIGGVDAAALPDVAAVAPAAQTARLAAEGLAPLDATPEVATAPTSEQRFDAIGVTWAREGAPADVAVWVRTHEAAGWTPWELLAPADTGPDDGTAEASRVTDRVATEPLLTDGADAFQVRIDAAGALSDARAELIDAGRSAADGAASATPPASGHRGVAAQPAAAITPMSSPGLPSGTPPRPYIISRSQWGADESIRGGPPVYTSPTKVGVVHHTVTSNSYSPTSAYAEIRAIYAYHTLSLGYNDIAYNVLVDKYGQIFEGRYGGVENPVLSAATAAFNSATFAVSALGSFDVASPTPQLLESLSQILAWKLAINFVDPLGESQLRSAGYPGSPHPAGEIVTFPDIIGHRDAFPTACPGDYLYGYLDYIRARVEQLTLAGLVHPAVDVTSRTPTANGSVHVTSALLYGGQWAVSILRPNGTLLRSFTGSGGSLDVTWPMTDGLLPAADGVYGVRIESNQNGTTALDFGTSVPTAGVIGALDSVVMTTTGFQASGWAAVTSGETANAFVGSDVDPTAHVAATGFRPDVGTAFPTLGPNRGFTTAFTISPGVHPVCAGADGAGLPARLFACLYVDSPRPEPIGNVETYTPEYGGVRITGWALDRNTTASISVRAYLASGIAGDYVANGSRPDVAAAYPVFGGAHGFSADVNTGPGVHHSCINGLNVGAGNGDGNLACPDLAPITGPPVGALDGIVSGTVRGWSFDPDTTAPITVHLYVDGAYRGMFTADGSRPDLASPFPFMGTAHGYAIPLPALGAGSHSVCVYAISVGTPTNNPLLGCRTTS